MKKWLALLAALLLPAISAQAEEPIRVSYLGPAGTYTEEAAQFWFRNGEDLMPKQTVQEAVADVAAGKADYAVIPQENTLGGAVVNYVDALIAEEKVYVAGEVILPISQTLMGIPGATLSGIRTVCSHAQGLTQSAAWRAEHLPEAETREMASTAAAASFVAEQMDPAVAAVAAPGAAALYGLEVLAENVQITKTNQTRFYVLSAAPLEAERLNRAVFIASGEGSRLGDILTVMQEQGLQVVSVHDRPEGSRLGMYRFVIEVSSEAGITAGQADAISALEGVRFAGRFNAAEKGVAADMDAAALLPGWAADSPALASITAFVERVTDEKSPDYLPPEKRIALFDSDGTLIGERYPTYSDQCMLLRRLLHDASTTGRGVPGDVAFAEKLEKAIRNHDSLPESPRSTAQMAAESFAGFTVEEYQAYVRDFLQQPVPGFRGMTYGNRLFLPMTELVRYLAEHDFQVFINSGTERMFLRVMIEEPLGQWIPPYRVIGSIFSLKASGQEDAAGKSYNLKADDQVLLGGDLHLKNVKMNKVISTVDEIGMPPVLVFGNSSGDFAMGQYALQHGGKAYMLLCDDTERDYGNTEVAEGFAKECADLGFETISMRDEFLTIYGDSVTKDPEAGLEEMIEEALKPAA